MLNNSREAAGPAGAGKSGSTVIADKAKVGFQLWGKLLLKITQDFKQIETAPGQNNKGAINQRSALEYISGAYPEIIFPLMTAKGTPPPLLSRFFFRAAALPSFSISYTV